jgi:transcriptional regulator with XRE-family HTH domain
MQRSITMPDMDTPQAKPSDVVKAAIREAGLSLGAIDRASGVSKAALSRFLSGKVGINVYTLDQLAPVLGLVLVRTKPAMSGDGKAPQAASGATGGGSGASARIPRQRGSNSPKKGRAL